MAMFNDRESLESQSSPGFGSKGQEPATEFDEFKVPSIALPKGGGAIRGIGEKFAANPVNGTGVQLDPLAFIALKESGVCEFEIPEWIFDLDYPGHYFRRLKTMSITIPAVVGPYTNLNATVTLLNSKVRTSARVTGNYDDEENYRPDHLAVEAIAASSSQNDSGRFELDFRSEKYLPFEGAGAISHWRVELPRKFRAVDYDTAADLLFHFKITSRRDEMLTAPALTALQAQLDAAGGGVLFRMFSFRHEFPGDWQAMIKSATHTATFTIGKDRFPLLVQGGTIDVVELHYALILKEPKPALGFT